MTTDFRALCTELLTWAERTSAHYVVPPDVILRARAALAQPLPEGPTDEEIVDLMPQQLWKDLATVSRLAAHGAGPEVGPGLFRVTLNTGIVEHCRAVLARWGRPAIEPVPVSERPILKSDPFNNADGHCWCGLIDFIDETGDHPVSCPASWELREPCPQDDCVLPHWALPVPQEEADG